MPCLALKQNSFQSRKESNDHRLGGVLATAGAVQSRVSPNQRRPGSVVVRPDNLDPRKEIQWQTGVVNAVNRYVETVSAAFDSLLEASELLVAGGVCVMMEQTHETKPLVERIKAARNKVCSVAEESRETLQNMANCLIACMEEFPQVARARSEYHKFTENVSSLGGEGAKNEMASMEEENVPKRDKARSRFTKKTSKKLTAHCTQSLTEKLVQNQEKLNRVHLCVEESEGTTFDSWQICRGQMDELPSLAEKIVCEVILALGSIAACGVSMRSSITSPTDCESPKHFTINVRPVLFPSGSGRIDQMSGNMDATDAALPANGTLHVDARYPEFKQNKPQNIPVHLRETGISIHRKLKAIAMLGDDLFSLNEAVFNVPVGSCIDADASLRLFQLMEQIHLYFQYGKYDKTDPNFLRDYVALLGTVQNQPFFGNQQGRAFRAWLFEALLAAGADQHGRKAFYPHRGASPDGPCAMLMSI